ncbi:MAG: pyruvate dehydrogenase (acetyl-transferring), homodimeric type [Planctomycetales bacterium]|nr:pyruvate dehydrogenase (acetyl-transferring), homodimeric type [Planctomycetales bacterium]
MTSELLDNPHVSGDVGEAAEWAESLDDVLHREGPERVRQLLVMLQEQAYRRGVTIPFTANTPYINTIPADQQPRYPGNREIERRIKSVIRWNAMAMVVRANRNPQVKGIGGHISTFASSATLYEVGFNHFFHAPSEGHSGDLVYFQGHASPGMYSRAFLEGRLTEKHLGNFRRELEAGGGLSSYPHPWLMPDFWQFPTVSMGLGPLCSIYQARFLRYLHNRGILDTAQSHVWCFVGDGEVDEPETLGAITLASREKLDNLIWVVNCNLQRLDGPVRGNGKIIQELEAAFRGAGWNCLKVVWGGGWDPLLARDQNGLLVHRMGEVVDGQYSKYVVENGAYIRDHFFGAHPELRGMVDHLTDDQLHKLNRGGHDPEKVFAAYKAAVEFAGAPTVILAKTIKGYGLGESGEGRIATHNQKTQDEEELREFRSRFGIPISDEDVSDAPFYRFPEGSPEHEYLQERRKSLGGYLPQRTNRAAKLEIPPLEALLKPVNDAKEASTTMSLLKIIQAMLRHKPIAKHIVPIIPDEARTFGFESLFMQCSIYAHAGQLYEPIDKPIGGSTIMYYKEAKNGQVLEEGINEAGAMGSFVAAGTAYANLGVNMIPIYVYYSMFGFQRVGDLIWLAADSRCKGFLVGGTAGRTTLNGEGLQHEDGHSHLAAAAVPNLIAYDPAYGYELAVIVHDGLHRMYENDESVFYYITTYNEEYEMREMPVGVEDGIRRGMYKLSSRSVPKSPSRPQLFGSGSLLRHAVEAQEILATKFKIASDVWSVTSYKELRRDALEVERWNMLHPDSKPRTSYVQQQLAGTKGPYIATSDYMKLLADQIRQWVPGTYVTLGTDGFGRSESREALRRHFEIDAAHMAFATLSTLHREGKVDKKTIRRAIKELNIDPEKIDPVKA